MHAIAVCDTSMTVPYRHSDRADPTSSRADQAGLLGEACAGFCIGSTDSRRADEDRQIERDANDRGELDEGSRRLRQRRKPSGNRSGDSNRQTVAVRVGRRAGLEQFDDQKRHALGSSGYSAYLGGVQTRVRVVNEPAAIAVAQRSKLKSALMRKPGRAGHQRRQKRSPGYLIGPVGDAKQDRDLRHSVDQPLHDRDRVGVRPLQIVQNDYIRPNGRSRHQSRDGGSYRIGIRLRVGATRPERQRCRLFALMGARAHHRYHR